MLREGGVDKEAARTLRAWVEDAWAQGERDGAEELWREARYAVARPGMTQELAEQPEESS